MADEALAGAAELTAKLQALGALDDGKIILGAVRAGMKEAMKVAATKIPVGTRLHRTYKGRLVAPGFGKRSLRVVTTRKTDSGRPAALLGVRGRHTETAFLERGTSKMKAQPWLRSSFYGSIQQQERTMVAYLNKCLFEDREGWQVIEEGLYSHLSSDTAVAGLVLDRVYGLIAPQSSALPRIVYSRIAATRTQTLCATDGKVRVLMQVDCYDRTYKGSKVLAKAVRQALTDFAGDMGGTRVSTVTLDSEVDLDDPDPGLYRVSQSYFIWFYEED